MTRNRMYARKSRPAVPWYGGVGELNRLVVGGLVVDIVMAVAADGDCINAGSFIAKRGVGLDVTALQIE